MFNSLRYWDCKETNVGATINYDTIIGQGIYDSKNVSKFFLYMSTPSFNQGLGLESAIASHNEFTIRRIKYYKVVDLQLLKQDHSHDYSLHHKAYADCNNVK